MKTLNILLPTINNWLEDKNLTIGEKKRLIKKRSHSGFPIFKLSIKKQVINIRRGKIGLIKHTMKICLEYIQIKNVFIHKTLRLENNFEMTFLL